MRLLPESGSLTSVAPAAVAPVRPPRSATARPVPPADRAGHASSATAVGTCCLVVIAIVFLQRLVIPLGEVKEVTVLLPIAWAAVAWLLLRNLAAVSIRPAIAVTVFLLAAFFSQVFGDTDLSMTSFGLLLAIYPLCAIAIRIDPDGYLRVLGCYQACTVVLALLTFLQLAVQAFGWPMPLLDDFLPAQIIVKNFNYVQEISYGSGFYKPNALFMLEASFLSQFLAMGLVLEYVYFRRTSWLALFGVALALTFSGTGYALAALGIGLTVLARGIDRNATVLAAVGLVVAAILVISGWHESVIGRLSEFSDSNASGSVRFIAPFKLMYDSLTDLRTLLWGLGAGYVDREIGAAWNPPTKVWVEYGLVAFMAYGVFLATLYRPQGAWPVAVALLAEYLFFGGGSLLQLPIVLLCLFLCFAYDPSGSGHPHWSHPAGASRPRS